MLAIQMSLIYKKMCKFMGIKLFSHLHNSNIRSFMEKNFLEAGVVLLA